MGIGGVSTLGLLWIAANIRSRVVGRCRPHFSRVIPGKGISGSCSISLFKNRLSHFQSGCSIFSLATKVGVTIGHHWGWRLGGRLYHSMKMLPWVPFVSLFWVRSSISHSVYLPPIASPSLLHCINSRIPSILETKPNSKPLSKRRSPWYWLSHIFTSCGTGLMLPTVVARKILASP